MNEKIQEMILKYEELTREKPFVILMKPNAYFELRNEIQQKGLKIDTIYSFLGIPIELSFDIKEDAVVINRQLYNKYLESKIFSNDVWVDKERENG